MGNVRQWSRHSYSNFLLKVHMEEQASQLEQLYNLANQINNMLKLQSDQTRVQSLTLAVCLLLQQKCPQSDFY